MIQRYCFAYDKANYSIKYPGHWDSIEINQFNQIGINSLQDLLRSTSKFKFYRESSNYYRIFFNGGALLKFKRAKRQ